MSVFGDFQRVWVQRFPESALPAAWEEDVRANLAKHKQKVAVLREELEKEEFYVEYLQRLLSDVERHKAVPTRTAPPVPAALPEKDKDVSPDTKCSEVDESVAGGEGSPPVAAAAEEEQEVVLRPKVLGSVNNAGHRSSVNQCISELSSRLQSPSKPRRCISELPSHTPTEGDAPAEAPGDFVTVIEVNGQKGEGGQPAPATSPAAPEVVAAKKKIPPRPPPKVFSKRGAPPPEPEAPPEPPSPSLRSHGSRESLASHSSHSITERVKSFESINSLSSERKAGLSRAATPQSLDEDEGEAEEAQEEELSSKEPPGLAVPAAGDRLPSDEPYYDTVPVDVNDGEYVYIQAGCATSAAEETASSCATLLAGATAQQPPESPGNSSNYVNIDYFIQHGASTVGTQRSGSVDSSGEGEGEGEEEGGGLDAPLLLRSISADPEPSGHAPISLTPLTPAKFLHQDGSGSIKEAERLTMHRCIVSSIVESETVYVECLYVMEKYMNAIKATLNSSQPVITEEEYNTIFYKISELHELHKKFLEGLRSCVQACEEPLQVGHHFKEMAQNINVYGAFLHNYGRATDAVRKCCAGSARFGDLSRHITCRGQPMSLEDLLHKPVARVQKNALVLHDLLKYTPLSHPDRETLSAALTLTQSFLDEFNIIQTKSMFPSADRAQRRLVKNSFIVELADGHRKLRHLFLFNDVIACAKYKASGREKFTFELKWYIPLSDIMVMEEPAAEPKETSPANIVALKSQACTVRDQILQEEKDKDDKKMRLGAARTADKHRKKLADLEAQLVLASPNLVFRVAARTTQRAQTFFLSSDFERTQWIDSIYALQTSPPPPAPLGSAPSMLELQAWVTACRSYLNTDMGSYLLRSGRDESLLLGDLHLNIGELLKPLEGPHDMYVCVEVDSYGHYFRKAKSRLVCKAVQPRWNETFVVELEGSQNLRVLLYEDAGGLRPLLRGKCTLKLSRQWLGEQQCSRSLSLGSNLSLSVCLKFVPSEVTLRRVPTAKPGALFGAKIQQVCKRQKRDIPFLVTSCVREVERRGMQEVGVYRVSGSASDLNKLKKSFETNSYEAEQLLKEVDIHSVTGILKLYLRELPEALFTDALYPKFVSAFGVGSGGGGGPPGGARRQELLQVYRSLPELNRKCVDFLLSHLLRVNRHEADNKMSLHNLATVFGPTLLRPSLRSEQARPRDLLAAGTVDVMAQAGILYWLLVQRRTEETSTS